MFAFFVIAGMCLFVTTRSAAPEACSVAQGDVSVRSVLGILVRNPLFFGNMVFLGAGFSMVEGLLFILLQDMNASSLLCGFSVVVTVIFELPIFHYAKPLLEWLGTRNMVLLGQAAWVVRAIFYANMSVAWMVLLIEPLHGITFALVWTAAIDHVSKPSVCGEGLEASGQAMLSACFMGIGPILGLAGGGLLFDMVGGHVAYSVFAGVVFVSGLMYWMGGETQSAIMEGGIPSKLSAIPTRFGNRYELPADHKQVVREKERSDSPRDIAVEVSLEDECAVEASLVSDSITN